MVKGDKVNIYHDPETKQKLEGKAKLLKQIQKFYWRVKFENGDIVDRFIY
jgi:hypothetical protein